MMRRITFVVLFPVLLFLIPLNFSYADDAVVLPKGVFKTKMKGKFYFNVDEKYGPGGDIEGVADDYNAVLDSSVFPDLSLVEAGFGLPPGFANIGRSVIDFDFDFNLYEFDLYYGLTDRLSIGIHIPYWDVKNNVDARVDNTNATVGANPFLGTPGDPFGGAPMIPVALGGVPLTTDQVQNLLVEQFGYKRVESWSGRGLSDIEVGFRYQYLKTDNWRLAFTGAVRLPTGEEDDLDDLMDYALGKNAYALLFHFNQDYIGIKNLVLNTTFRYDLYLPDKETLRILYDVDKPITPYKEKVDRDYGDIVELEVSGTYEFIQGWQVSLLYKYAFAFETDIDGDMGYAYSSLEDETDCSEHVGIIGLSYSTIELYKQKKFAVPLTASISYRNRFAGSNNSLRSEYISLGLDFFF
jgi:Putative MetA-pathway of phenol degradation